MRIINIFGTIGSGKTYCSKLISDRLDALYIQTDLLFKMSILANQDFQTKAKKYWNSLGVEMYVDGKYNVKDITEKCFHPEIPNDYSVLNGYNEIVSPFLERAIHYHLEVYKKDMVIIESALPLNIPNTITEWIQVHRPFDIMALLKRDPHRSHDLSYRIYEYQIHEISSRRLMLESDRSLDFSTVSNYCETNGFGTDENIISQFTKILSKEF